MNSEEQKIHQICSTCNNSDFYKEDGYYFCSQCQSQSENIREEVLERQYDSTIRLNKTRIQTSNSNKTEEIIGWTSWELYNYALIGITNELIMLGSDPEVKLTVLQLWACYLGKLEVAFTSSKKKCVPKLAKKFYKKDAEIIYGKVKKQKRKRSKAGSSMSVSSVVSSFHSETSSKRELSRRKRLMVNAECERYFSQVSSENDTLSLTNHSLDDMQSSYSQSSVEIRKIKYNRAAKQEIKKVFQMAKKVPRTKRAKYKHSYVTTRYKMSPQMITPMKLWAIAYLALRIHGQKIHISDMLRFGREGHLSYYRLDRLLPPELLLVKSDFNLLSANIELTHKGFRKVVADMAKFLGVYQFSTPDFGKLAEQYCIDLQLPRGILLYTKRLITLSQPKMYFDLNSSYVPNYEGRIMAFVIVVLKLLFSFDGITEYQISRVAEQVNNLAAQRNILDSTLFSFREWQRYIECRRHVLMKEHFPTKFKYTQDAPGSNHLFLRFLQYVQCRREGDQPEMTSCKHSVPKNLTERFKYCIDRINEDTSLEDVIVFAPSLTPQHSYLQQLLEHPSQDLPLYLKINFEETKVGYMTKPNKLKDLATQCDINLNIIDCNLHFVEKFVPPFEQPRMPSVQEFKETVQIESCSSYKSESLIDYLHKKQPINLKLHVIKQSLYDGITMEHMCEFKEEEKDCYSFNQILPTGKLIIPFNEYYESDEDVENKTLHSVNQMSLLSSKFCEKYNLYLSEQEKQSVTQFDNTPSVHYRKPKRPRQLYRNKRGRFIKVATEDKNKSKDEKILVHSASSEDENYNSQKKEKVNRRYNTREKIIPNHKFDTSNTNLKDICREDVLSPSYQNVLNNDCESYSYHFQPSKHYWMYHCIFSRVKPKNFELFEKELPTSFRWLLNECASVLEMTTQDLYEEVCLVENYFAYIFKPTNTNSEDNKINSQCFSQKHITQRW